MNPWENISLFDYEQHMKLSGIGQLQALNVIMKRQLEKYSVKSLAILGVAGGNGLEHIGPNQFEKVYGIDINQDYLNKCKERFAHLGGMLVLQKADFTDNDFILPSVDLIIANLFIEYAGIDVFVKKLAQNKPEYLSCVITQSGSAKKFVSESPYADSFRGLEKLHNDIDKDMLSEKIKNININPAGYDEYIMPNGKKLITLDFVNADLLAAQKNC